MQTVVDLIKRSFSLHGSRTAIRIYDNLWTYDELRRLSNSISTFLLESRMKRGDRVIVSMNKSIYLYAAIIGIMQAGGIYVPLDTRTPSIRLAKILDDIDPFCVFIDRNSLRNYQECEKLLSQRPRALYLDDGEYDGCKKISFTEESKKATWRFPQLSSEDLALILYTSGSTGVPKGAMITHGNFYNIINFTIEAFDYASQEVASALNANAFDMSLTDIFPILCSGGMMGVYPEEVMFPRDILDLTYKYGITKMALVPSTLSALVNSGLARPELLRGLKDIHMGGEPIPSRTLMQIMDLLPQARISNCYGPTETILYVSYHIFNKPFNPEVNVFPIGFPIANNKFVLDSTGFSDPEKGELIIVGPQVGAGYWRDPARTKIFFGINENGEKYYRTGDVASFDPSVGYFVHGRKDHQVKFRGYRIGLGEIENVLSLLPFIKENVVIPVYGKDRIEELRLVYSGDGDRDKEIRKHLKKHLPNYMIPKSMIRIENLPKNQNNKIDRALVEKLYGGKGRIVKNTLPLRKSGEGFRKSPGRRLYWEHWFGGHDEKRDNVTAFEKSFKDCFKRFLFNTK